MLVRRVLESFAEANRPCWPLVCAGLLAAVVTGGARAIVPDGSSDVAPPCGVMVDTVSERSVLFAAGLQQGDVLLSWSRTSSSRDAEVAGGKIEGVFDWRWLVLEEAPRGTITLEIMRGGAPMRLEVQRGLWKAGMLPRLGGKEIEQYRQLRRFLDDENLHRARDAWLQTTRFLRAVSRGLRVAMLLRLGDLWTEAAGYEEAKESYSRALELADSEFERAEILRSIGEAYQQEGALDQAAEQLRAALDLVPRKSLAAAALRIRLAIVAYRQGDLGEAKDLGESAIGVYEEFAPESSETASSLNVLGVVLADLGRYAEAEAHHRRALGLGEALPPEGDLLEAAALNNLGALALTRDRLEEAMSFQERALDLQRRWDPRGLDVGISLAGLGNLAQRRGELASAGDYYRRALEVFEKLPGEKGSLQAAAVLTNLGILALHKANLDEAEAHWENALTTLRMLAPGSVDVVSLVNNLGVLARERGQLERAFRYYQQALAIEEQAAPDSLGVSTSLANLAALADERGNLQLAQDLQERALSIREKLAPNSSYVADSLSNLAVVDIQRGYLERADGLLDRALSLRRKLSPQSFEMSPVLFNLGVVAAERLAFDRAIGYYQEALLAARRASPASRDIASITTNLANIHLLRGHLDRASTAYEDAIQLLGEVAPQSPELAATLNGLGTLRLRERRFERAEEAYEQALSILMIVAPKSASVADNLAGIGLVKLELGDLETAKGHFEAALELRHQIAPGSSGEAVSLRLLGKVAGLQGKPHLAASYLRLAVESLESQLARAGVSGVPKSRFRAEFRGIYEDAVEALRNAGLLEHAFDMLERSRARTFLELLAEKELVFGADLPSALEEGRRRLAVLRDRIERKIVDVSSSDQPDEMEQLQEERQELRWQAEELEKEIRKVSPRLASLQYPEPLGLDGARKALDSGTLMLSYAVGEERSFVFAVSPESDLSVHELSWPEDGSDAAVGPLSGELLESAVREVREAIPRAEPTTQEGSEELAKIRHAMRTLYDVLVGPVEARVMASRRLLIVPDGPLHTLPWGALVREIERGLGARSWQYLVEWKPLHLVLSATVYGELKRGRSVAPLTGHDGASPLLVVFADPFIPPALRGDASQGARDVRVRAAVERGFRFEPLPGSRREAAEVAGLYPRALTYLGTEATEERAKESASSARILHFATHGTLDGRSPLSSAVVLMIPERAEGDGENGLLQAWEIFEGVRFDADLVVLSACESALGEELGAEGLIGLTRAFQYAGARTVAASLWKVPDATTAALMVRFHRHLREGTPKDQALRAAQLELIRGPVEVPDLEAGESELAHVDASSPYFWAPFQLYGDWR